METTQKEKKERYQVYFYPSLRRRLRQVAFDREQSISALLHDAVIIGLEEIRKTSPAKPAG